MSRVAAVRETKPFLAYSQWDWVPVVLGLLHFAGVIAREIDQTAKLMQAAGLKPE